MSTIGISTELAKAIKMWNELARSTGGYRICNWSLDQTFRELDESLELDPSEITANLLLTYFLNDYLKNSSLSLYDLLIETPHVKTNLNKAREILTIIQSPEIVDARNQFINTLTGAMNTYGATDREDVQKLLGTYDQIAILRRDALRSINKLKVDQFISGEYDPVNVKPTYNRMVYRWENINSLITALPHQPSGVSLNLIRPAKNPMRSYFCFAIRNGGNIFIISDAPDDAHPLQRYMSRRPDRNMDSRISKNWFPYELLDIEYDEKGDLHVNDNIPGLVPYQKSAYTVKAIAELEANTFAWTSMMFDLIVDKFWRKKHSQKELSYTNEMLQTHTRFLISAERANIQIGEYTPLGIEPLNISDVCTENIPLDVLGKKCTDKNLWLEERYGKLVPPEVYNALESSHKYLTLDYQTSEIISMDSIPNTTFENTKLVLNTNDPADFGTRKQIESDMKFIARSNYAKCINHYAHEEFKKREKEVLDWYRTEVSKNLDNLLRLCGHGELWIDGGETGVFSGFESGVGNVYQYRHETETRIYRTFLDTRELADNNSTYGLWTCKVNFRGPTKEFATCYLNNTKASYAVVFSPGVSEELAFLSGHTVDELPDVLQNWNLYNQYVGNSILDRIDPLEWMVHNPWAKLRLSVAIFLSKRGLATLKKVTEPKVEIPNLIRTPPWKTSEGPTHSVTI